MDSSEMQNKRIFEDESTRMKDKIANEMIRAQLLTERIQPQFDVLHDAITGIRRLLENLPDLPPIGNWDEEEKLATSLDEGAQTMHQLSLQTPTLSTFFNQRADEMHGAALSLRSVITEEQNESKNAFQKNLEQKWNEMEEILKVLESSRLELSHLKQSLSEELKRVSS